MPSVLLLSPNPKMAKSLLNMKRVSEQREYAFAVLALSLLLSVLGQTTPLGKLAKRMTPSPTIQQTCIHGQPNTHSQTYTHTHTLTHSLTHFQGAGQRTNSL